MKFGCGVIDKFLYLIIEWCSDVHYITPFLFTPRCMLYFEDGDKWEGFE